MNWDGTSFSAQKRDLGVEMRKSLVMGRVKNGMVAASQPTDSRLSITAAVIE